MNRIVVPLALAAAAFASGYFWSTAFGSPPSDPVDRIGEPARDTAPSETDDANADNEPATLEASSDSTPDRSEIPHEATVQDRVAQLDVLIDELVALSSDKTLEEEDAKTVHLGLRRALGKLKNWERAELRRLAEIQRAKRAGQATFASKTKQWVANASQLADPGLRTQAIEDIRAALSSRDPNVQLAALNALRRLHDVEFEKAGFRDLVLPFASKAKGAARVAAMYALSALGRRPEDLHLALALVDSPSAEARHAASHLAMLYSGGDLTGTTGAAIERLFDTDDKSQIDRAMNGLWGAKVSPGIEKRILDLSNSDDREMRGNAIYFGLSTLKDKSPAVIRKLVEVLGDNDPNNSGRALWGLGHGVTKENGHLVVQAMKSYFSARSTGRSKTSAVELIGRYGSKADIPWLQAIADNPQAGDRLRKAAQRSLGQVKRR